MAKAKTATNPATAAKPASAPKRVKSAVVAAPPVDLTGILRVFFEEVVDTLQTAATMMDARTHEKVCQKFFDFFAYRIPGSDAAAMAVGAKNIQRRPSVVRRVANRMPLGLKLFLAKFSWLYIFFLAIDAFLDPVGSSQRRVILRGEIRKRVPTDLRYQLARSKFILWIDEKFLRAKWQRDLEYKPLWMFSRAEIERFVEIIVRDNKISLLDGWQAAQKLEADRRDVYVFVSHLFPTTWSPTVRSLNDRGNHTVWCGIDNPQESAGYGVLETPLVQTTSHVNLTFLGCLVFLCGTRRSQILMSGECFYGSNWNAEDTTVLYSLLASVLSTMRRKREDFAAQAKKKVARNLNLLMYDGLKPINASGSSDNTGISYFYKRLMKLGDRIIYNSNTELLGTFNRYSIPLTTPALHFYRYSEAPAKLLPRIDFEGGKNIHVACITVCLNEFGEPSRDRVAGYVRDMILSGIHFHYYCMTTHPVILKFKRDLGAYGDLLHLHPIIKDQAKLVEELHQYHVGFNPSDYLPFAHGIASMSDRFYQDGMSVFLQSTIGTSFLVYAAAGLPVLLPRGCVGAADLLGDVALPVIFSEMDNLRMLLEECDLERRFRVADANCAEYHIDTHIDRFLDFVKT